LNPAKALRKKIKKIKRKKTKKFISRKGAKAQRKEKI